MTDNEWNTRRAEETVAADSPEASTCIKSLVDFQRSLGDFTVAAAGAKAAALGYGWWVRVVRTSDGIRRLHAAELSNEASPLVRTLLHHTAALAWLRNDADEVIQAVVAEHAYRRQRLGQKAIARQWDLKGLRLGPPPKKQAKPSGMTYLERFEELCERIHVPDLYVAYMIESGYAHPSGVSADTYIEATPDGRLALRSDSSEPGVPLKATALFAAVATNEFGNLIHNEHFKSTAVALGKRLGRSVEL